MNGGRFVASTASEDYSAIHSYSSIVVNGGTLVANHDEAIGMYAWGSIVLGWTNITDRITISSCYAGNSVSVREGQYLTDGTDIYEGEIDHGDIAGKTLRPYVQPSSFKDPEGAVIDDPNVLSWLSNNGFTQDDIDRLGSDAAATEKLYECYLVNCDLKVQGAGGTLSLTGIAVTNGVVSVTVQLVRTAPLGVINGVLSLYGTSDLALGFDGGQIENESISFGEGDDPGFDTEKSTDSVSQSVTATFDVSHVTDKFFKAAIEFQRSEEQE
jgi:hypothetical protein